MELAALQEVYGRIQEAGGSLVCVCPQLTKYSKQVVKKNGLTFPVVTDQGNKYATRLNLEFVLPDTLQEIYKKLGIDLERFNGNDSWVLPMAARFIIDSTGTIRNAEVNLDHTLRPEPEEIIEIMKSLN